MCGFDSGCLILLLIVDVCVLRVVRSDLTIFPGVLS